MQEELSFVPIDKNHEGECFFRYNYTNAFNKVLSKKTPKKYQHWNAQSKPKCTIYRSPVSATTQNFITVSLWILTLGRHNRRDKSNEMLLSSYICTARLNEKVLQV